MNSDVIIYKYYDIDICWMYDFRILEIFICHTN